MKKEDIKKVKAINFNHQWVMSLDSLPCGRSIFAIKKGLKRRYFLEIVKDACSVSVERYNFRSETFSKYDEKSNHFFGIFKNLDLITYEFIEQFGQICEAKKILEKFNIK